MSVTLRKKPNSDGSISLYLDVYHNKKRHKEYLKDCKLYKATNAVERKHNKETLELANNIALKRGQELVSQGYDVVASFKSNVDFIEYFENYISKYTKKDKRNMEGACNKFKDFMKKEGIRSLTMKQLTENIIHNYAEYLSEISQGEGASSYFKRFKKMIKQAVREKVILNNPATDVSIKKDDSVVKDGEFTIYHAPSHETFEDFLRNLFLQTLLAVEAIALVIAGIRIAILKLEGTDQIFSDVVP